MYFCNILSNKPAQNMSLLDSKNQSNHTRTNGIWGHGLRCLYNHLYIIITRCLEQTRFPTVTHWDWFWNCTWDPFCCLRLLAFHQSHQNCVAHNTYKLDKIFKAFWGPEYPWWLPRLLWSSRMWWDANRGDPLSLSESFSIHCMLQIVVRFLPPCSVSKKIQMNVKHFPGPKQGSQVYHTQFSFTLM